MFSSITKARVTLTALMMAGLTQIAHANPPTIRPQGSIATPEPSSWAAFAIGGVALAVLAYKARQRQAKA